MAGPKGSKYFNIFLDYSIQLEHKKQGRIFDASDFSLLKSIEATGSLKEAAAEMNISYRKAWGKLQQMEDSLGFSLVNRQRGGAHGGKTTLTDDGLKLIEAHMQLRAEFDTAIHTITKKFFHELNQSE